MGMPRRDLEANERPLRNDQIMNPYQVHMYFSSFGENAMALYYSIDNKTLMRKFNIESPKGSQRAKHESWESLHYEYLKHAVEHLIESRGKKFGDFQMLRSGVPKIFIHIFEDFSYINKIHTNPENMTEMFFHNLIANDDIEFVYTEKEILNKMVRELYDKYAERAKNNDLDSQYMPITMREALDNVGFYGTRNKTDELVNDIDETIRIRKPVVTRAKWKNEDDDDSWNREVRRF